MEKNRKSSIRNRAQIVKKLKDVDYVGTMADIWSARQRSSLGMTCHWINLKENTSQSTILAFRRVKGECTNNLIAKFIYNIHCEYELDTTKACHIITDSGSNFLKAFRKYGVSAENAEDGQD